MKRQRDDESGQATMEFALTMLLLMGFVFFFLQFSLVSAVGNYIQYATFMGARAYLSAGSDPEEQRIRAREVMVRAVKKSTGQGGLDRWPILARGVAGQGEPAGVLVGPGPNYSDKRDKNFNWQEGVRYVFRSRLFLMPLLGDGSGGTLDLTSESWLGREPTYQECLRDVQSRSNGRMVLDNGC